MSLTFTSYEGAAAVAALTQYTLVATVSDGEGRAKSFSPVNAPTSGTEADTIYPSISSSTRITDPQGGASGGVKLILTPASSDEVNISSPMVYVLDGDAAVITVSGTF